MSCCSIEAEYTISLCKLYNQHKAAYKVQNVKKENQKYTLVISTKQEY